MALPVPFDDAALLADIRRRPWRPMPAADRGLHPRAADARRRRTELQPGGPPEPTVVIIVKPFADPPARTFTEGIRLSLVSVRRNHPLALNPMIKSNNLLNNALAMQEALRAAPTKR